jgi:signal transduction histidine kinase
LATPFPSSRAARGWLAALRASIPPWLTPFCERALPARRAQQASALLLGVLPVVVLALDQRLPPYANLDGLAVLVVLVAGGLLRCSLLIPVLAVAWASEVAHAAMGEHDPPVMVLRLAVLASVAGIGRLGVLGFTHMRDARHHDISTLLLASHAMGSSEDLERVATEAVRAAARTVARPGLAGGRPAALLQVSEGAVALACACDATGAVVPGARDVDLGPATAPVLQALATGRTAVVRAEQVPAGLRELSHAGGQGAWALARVRVAGKPFGVLAVASPHVAEFRPEDLRLLDGIARVAGLALATALRHAELEELKGRLQDGVDLALEAGRSLKPADVVASTLVRAAAGVAADHATLACLADGELEVRATYRAAGGGQLVAGDRRFPAESVRAVPRLAEALASGQPTTGGPLEADAAGRELVAALSGGRHTLLYPFVDAGPTTCVLVLSRHGDQPFEAIDLARLEPMADVALLTMRNAHLYAQAEKARLEARRHSARLRLAIEAAEDIGTSQELAEVLDGVLRRAAEVAHADRGSISRADGDRFVVEHSHDPTGVTLAIGTAWTLGDSGIAREAILTGRAVQSNLEDMPELPTPLASWGRRAGVHHVVVCPLTVGREPVGVLGLSRRHDAFSEDDLLNLRPFATLAGLLLRNARLLDEARQVGRAKSKFLNLAAHELRTPLAVIKGYLSMLDDGTFDVPERTRNDAVGILVQKAAELEVLVESLLTTARMEVGGLPRAPVELDVGEAVRDALSRVAPRARLEGARIEARLPDSPLVVCTDADHVARILDNLLNNALTYSDPPADVAVSIRRGDGVEVVVVDRGMGIPADQHDRVFERFYRLDSEASRFRPGGGRGVSISRELARANGGELALERSVPGRGSTFVLRVPAE